MSNAVFPILKGLTFPVLKKPTFSTLEQESVSGKKKEIANWVYPRWQLELTFEFLRDAAAYNELKTLAGFFLAMLGKFDTFLFDDPDDNFVTGQQLGEGDGQTTVFQFVRTFGGFLEPITDLNDTPAPVIYLNGAAQASGLYSIGFLDSGLLTFTAAPAPGAVVSADFGYYWRCRFQNDLYEFSKFLYQVWELKKLTLETVK
jgi:uncharacterized protein (TIGR02217 family)